MFVRYEHFLEWGNYVLSCIVYYNALNKHNKSIRQRENVAAITLTIRYNYCKTPHRVGKMLCIFRIFSLFMHYNNKNNPIKLDYY